MLCNICKDWARYDQNMIEKHHKNCPKYPKNVIKDLLEIICHPVDGANLNSYDWSTVDLAKEVLREDF